jgi:hypothetical protein
VATPPSSAGHPQHLLSGLASHPGLPSQLPVQPLSQPSLLPPARPPAASHLHPSLDTPGVTGVTGFAVGGKSGRANVPYFDYER